MPRSVSHDGTRTVAHDGAGSGSGGAPAAGTKRGLSMVDAAAAAPAASPKAASRSVASPSSSAGSIKVPFGYVKGAICIEPPKRSRTHPPASARC